MNLPVAAWYWGCLLYTSTDIYLDYIKTAALSFAAQPSVEIEKRVCFAPYTHKEPGDEVEGSGIADCVMSVSYTHLDVYKRQSETLT